MLPEQITGFPASRGKGMPFSHHFRGSAGAADGNCSNVQSMIKENASNNLEVVQTTSQRWFSQLSDFALLHIHSQQQKLEGIILLHHPKTRLLFPTMSESIKGNTLPLVSFPSQYSVNYDFPQPEGVTQTFLITEVGTHILILFLDPNAWSTLFFYPFL